MSRDLKHAGIVGPAKLIDTITRVVSILWRSWKGNRPSKEALFLAIAYLVSLRSTCRRLAVGCVVTDKDGTTILSMGYNGNYAGGPNDCDTDQPGACGCLHSEDNAIAVLPYHGVDDLVLYCTHTPCVQCAKRILRTKIRTVVCGEAYRSDAGAQLLSSAGIRVRVVT